MKPTAKNSQAIVDALTDAQYKLIDARQALESALENARLDYEYNDETLKNLGPAVLVILSAVSNERYTWGLYNEARKREEAAKARYLAMEDSDD